DQSTTDRLSVAEATYREAIALSTDSDQQVDRVFGLAGLAWLQGRRGEERECGELAAEVILLCGSLGTRLLEVWATAALGELELVLGRTAEAIERLEQQNELLRTLGVTDPD